MSLRNFIRALKSSNIGDDAELMEFLTTYTLTTRQTGVRALQDYLTDKINVGVNAATQAELLNVLNSVIPCVVDSKTGDSLEQQFYTNIRQSILKKHGAESVEYKKSMTLMRFNKEKWAANRAKYNASIVEANRVPVIYNWDNVKRAIIELYESNNHINHLLFLQIAGGSRIGELIYASTFEHDEKNNGLIQHGVLKAKNIRGVKKPSLFIAPVEFIKMFENVREHLTAYTNAEEAQALNAVLNRRVRRVFKRDDMSTHDLRKIYANIAFSIYEGPATQTYFTSSILGHDLKSLTISSIYTTAKINLTPAQISQIRNREVLPLIHKNVVVPYNTQLRDGDALGRLKKTIDALNHNGVKITQRLLKSYGYSSRTVGIGASVWV